MPGKFNNGPSSTTYSAILAESLRVARVSNNTRVTIEKASSVILEFLNL